MFLGARDPAAAPAPAATLLGVPYDGASSFRRGARHAPSAIRWASQSIESYSPALDRDLEEIVLVDAGDLAVEALAPEAMVDQVARAVGELRGFPCLLGGDHTITVGGVRAAAVRHGDLRVILLDAHLDLRDDYDGTSWSHATTSRRLSEIVPPARLAILGVRSGTREEFRRARDLLALSRDLRIPEAAWPSLEGFPIYLSVDIDALDPAAAPGTGNPEAGGPGAEEILALLRVLAPCRVIGMDLVEVAPPYDPSGRTAALAATIVRDALLTWAWRNTGA